MINQNSINNLVVVTPTSVDSAKFAKAAAKRYGLYYRESHNRQIDPNFIFNLQVNTDSVELLPLDNRFGPVSINFSGGRSAHRQKYGGGKNQPLPRAIGLKGSNKRHHVHTVLDVTAGFGTDAFVLATLGCDVTLVETKPGFEPHAGERNKPCATTGPY